MSDVPAFAEDLDSGYEEFRTEVLVRQKGAEAVMNREQDSGRAPHQAARRYDPYIAVPEAPVPPGRPRRRRHFPPPTYASTG